MKRRSVFEAVIAIVVALVFVFPGLTTGVCGGDELLYSLDEGFDCEYDGDASVVGVDDVVFVSYSFQKPTIEAVDVAGVVYDRVFLSGLSSFGNPGEPMLPSAAGLHP